MQNAAIIANRYRIQLPPIGEGGMGVVYKAADLRFGGKFVALKTIRGSLDPTALEHFRKEWDVLSRLCHPNIIDVIDVGEFVDEESGKPFFAMPLLSGKTLDALIRHASHQLTEERVIAIMCQVCRGLQAAHEQNLVHRDLKPSNIFVLSDDSIKIIDFGVVHFTTGDTRTAMKGTPPYMAPEQFEGGPITAQSDLFSLAVICYEALTGRKPFEAKTFEALAEAICRRPPIPALELNPSLTPNVVRAIHKALAKQPYHRFTSVREFADVLQRAIRNEPIEFFDRTRIGPRVIRIKRALTDGDHQYALDLVGELESEGNADNEISFMRIQAEQGLRAKMVKQLLDGARGRMEEEEYPLALQKVQNALELDPGNIDANALRNEIEQKRSHARIDQWQRIANQHFSNGMFPQARQAVEEILRLDAGNAVAKQLLSEITQREREYGRLRQERQQLYSSALTAYKNGDISSAYNKLQKAIELGKRVPAHPNTDAQYLALYEQIRSERDEMDSAYVESKAALNSGNFDKALKTCNQILRRRPNDARFQALKIDIEDRQRQARSATLAELHTRIEGEPDLEKKYQLLKEAVQLYPEEQTFSGSLKLVREKRDLVNGIVSRARHYETRGQFSEALGQWDILRTIYEKYPGLEYEINRISRLQEEQVREEVSNQDEGELAREVEEHAPDLHGVEATIASGAQPDRSSAEPAYSRAPVAPAEVTAPAHLRVAAAAAGSSGGHGVPAAQNFSGNGSEPFRATVVIPPKTSWSEVNTTQFHPMPVTPVCERTPEERVWRDDIADRGPSLTRGPKRTVSRQMIFGLTTGLVVVLAVLTAVLLWNRPLKNPRKPASPAQTASQNTQESASSGVNIPGAAGKAQASDPQRPSTAQGAERSPRQPAPRISFTVDSDAPGAQARVDGQPPCATPCSLKLAPGSHNVVMSAAGHQTVDHEFYVESNGNDSNLVTVKLPELMATWYIVTKPGNINVEIDGTVKGQTPRRIELSIGQHKLRLFGEGFDHNETVDVTEADAGILRTRCISLSTDSPCESPAQSGEAKSNEAKQ